MNTSIFLNSPNGLNVLSFTQIQKSKSPLLIYPISVNPGQGK